MSDGTGPIVTFVGVGVVYLIAEVVAAIILVSAVAVFIGVVLAVLCLCWIIANPIATWRGWILFLAGGTTLVLLPFLFVLAVPLRGHTHETTSQMSGGNELLLFLCGLWLFASLFGLIPFYRFCLRIDGTTGWETSASLLALLAAAITIPLYAAASSSNANAQNHQDSVAKRHKARLGRLYSKYGDWQDARHRINFIMVEQEPQDALTVEFDDDWSQRRPSRLYTIRVISENHGLAATFIGQRVAILRRGEEKYGALPNDDDRLYVCAAARSSPKTTGCSFDWINWNG